MTTKVENVRCINLGDCHERGLGARDTRALADWHHERAKSAPAAAARSRHRVISAYFGDLTQMLSGARA